MIKNIKYIVKKTVLGFGFRISPNDAVYIAKKLSASRNPIKKWWLMHLKQKLFVKFGLEIDSPNIGEHLVLGHPYGITVNCRAVIGNDCVLFKGVTIGSIRSGKKEGVPTLGNNVVCCVNSFICGNIHIGDDVLIAANSFVNFDVPSHSVVVGNPGVIHSKVGATSDYFCR